MADEIQAPSETDLVEILSAPTPPSVEAWRDEEPGRRMYGAAGFESVVPSDAFDGAPLPTEKRQAAVENLRGMLADTGLSANDAKEILARAAIVRHDGKSTEERLREARKELVRQFPGDANDPNKGAEQVLKDAARMLGRDLRLAKYLDAQGLSNDPPTLTMLARAARSQRMAGRLK